MSMKMNKKKIFHYNHHRRWSQSINVCFISLLICSVELRLVENCLSRSKSIGKINQNDKENNNGLWDQIIFSQQYSTTTCKKLHSESPKCSLNQWSIHGIWPNHVQYCKRVKFDEDELNSIRSELEAHWFTLKDGSYKFWQHEWLKHGSCAGNNTALNTQLKYFQQGLHWNAQWNLDTIFSQNSITPSDTVTYTEEQFESAIQKSLDVTSQLVCYYEPKSEKQYIQEIRLCINKNLKLWNCMGSSKRNECRPGPIYYPIHLT